MGRKLGQHFLVRKATLARIADETCPADCETVVEIGPGKGALTEFLLERARRVIAIEVDPALASHLWERFPGVSALEVLNADVLKTNLSQWGPMSVAGNLPYYITSPIIEKTLALGPLLRVAVFLVQKEVADRLSAQPGTRDYGFLTVQSNLFAVPKTVLRVPPDAFHPPPKVDSAVVRFDPRPEPVLSDPASFLRFAGLCFRHKRKTLRNNLAGVYGKEIVDALPEASLRAEQLSIENLLDLYRRLERSV